MQGGRVSGTPDSPAVILIVPAEVLNNDVLGNVLFLGGDRNDLSVGPISLCLGRCGGLAACDAHDDLADAGFRDLGNGCCAVRDDTKTGESSAGPSEVFHELPGNFLALGAAFNLSDKFAAEVVASDSLDLGDVASED